MSCFFNMLLFWENKRNSYILTLKRLLSSACISTSPTSNSRRSEGTPLFTKPPAPQSSPIHKLPTELLQLITTYLPPQSTSAFSLTGRYICYVVGREHLYTYLHPSATTKFVKRDHMEILECAFPSHYYCPWCDKFHQRHPESGPKTWGRETKRNCQAWNGYLHAGKDYVLMWHHVRLAVNRASWGEEFGIPLDDFVYRKDGCTSLGKENGRTRLDIEAKIVSGRFLLHSTFSIAIPRSSTRKKNFMSQLFDALPQNVVGHRDDREGHSGLQTYVSQAVSQSRYHTAQLCSACASDYRIMSEVHTSTPSIIGETLFLTVESWRDLGSGRNPFEGAWRAHGEIGNSAPGFGADIVRLTNFKIGQVRRAFELEIDLPHGSDLAKNLERMISPENFNVRCI